MTPTSNARWPVSVTGALSEDDPVRGAEFGAELSAEILPVIAARHTVEWDLGGLALQQDAFLDEAMMGFLLCILGIYLVLGWVFASWFRPLIVRAVIPFGLIGTVWGHAQFGLAMSLFPIIGPIGMSGIIITEAIVLVTTVRDCAKRLPIARAAVAGAKDRLRPILLTTLTTVLGLAPLMCEGSRQSLFLKPTVVTLVYGLAVGFFIVLLMVPSPMVVRVDVAKAFQSLRRLAGGGIEPSVGGVGDSFEYKPVRAFGSNDPGDHLKAQNALAETINGLFKAEVLHRRGPWRNFDAVEYATLEWVDWFNTCRLLEPIHCRQAMRASPRGETSRRRRLKPTSTQLWKLEPWPHTLHQPTSGETGAVRSDR